MTDLIRRAVRGRQELSPVFPPLSKPQLETEGIYSIQVVLDKALAPTESQLGVQVESAFVADLRLEYHL